MASEHGLWPSPQVWEHHASVVPRLCLFLLPPPSGPCPSTLASTGVGGGGVLFQAHAGVRLA